MRNFFQRLKDFFKFRNNCPELPAETEEGECERVRERLAYSIQYDPHSKILFQYIKKSVSLNEAIKMSERLAPGWRMATPGELLNLSGLFAHADEKSFNQCPLVVWSLINEGQRIAVLNPDSENFLTLIETDVTCKAEVVFVFDRSGL
ncbi:hypothetical protein [Bacillus sp. SG-1]|uniref:hypothetical protein n=1 Tax=Bacillus sp. SG-1 TaxID=161544 RepID=UPI0001544AB2|nr:hypothetical protein [Bacillus sp. SG-1]EDL64234.1 hypothetical protein BSG1_00105 [Bacillus sp. SG-1]